MTKLATILFVTLCFSPQMAAAAPILIGLDADLSSGSARSGESIQRGAQLAIDEINQQGGVLGRSLKLLVKDHRGNPQRGVDNVLELSAMDNVVAILSGLHTPVAMKELKVVHQNKIPFLVPWAAGTPVVKNGYQPNYVFRVSARDEYVGGFLVQQALKQGYRSIGLLLERTGWGRSNEKAMRAALSEQGLSPVAVEWFHWGETRMDAPLQKMGESGAELILLVANAPEGKSVIRAMAALPQSERTPIISHWGITGGTFYDDVKDQLHQIDLQFLQTYSFLQPYDDEVADRVITQYCQRYGCSDLADPARAIFAPVGTAHAYDLVHLLAKAIQQAGSAKRGAVRNALENIPAHKGLVRDYTPPFTERRHDALEITDFKLSQYASDGVITPITPIAPIEHR